MNRVYGIWIYIGFVCIGFVYMYRVCMYLPTSLGGAYLDDYR